MLKVGLVIFVFLSKALGSDVRADPEHYRFVQPGRAMIAYPTTPDGVSLRLDHLSRPEGPVVLLLHGLFAQGLSMEKWAEAFYQAGFDVWVGNFRGAAKLPQGLRPYGERNGLDEYVRQDLPTMLRHMRAHASARQLAFRFTIVGHSLGGVVRSGLESDEALWTEFGPYCDRSAIPLGSPFNASDVGLMGRLFVQAASRPLDLLASRGERGIGIQPFLSLLSPSSAETPLVRELGLAMASLAVSPDHTDRDEFRRALSLMPAHSLSIELLQQLRDDALGDGQFRYRDGGPVIRPERLLTPHLMVRSEHDQLAPWESQGRYFAALAAREKRLLSIKHMNHLDLVLSAAFIDYAIRFVEAPDSLTLGGLEIRFNPCRTPLQRLRMRIRVLKGMF